MPINFAPLFVNVLAAQEAIKRTEAEIERHRRAYNAQRGDVIDVEAREVADRPMLALERTP